MVHALRKPGDTDCDLTQSVAILFQAGRRNKRTDTNRSVIRNSMNGIGCGVIGGKVRWDRAIEEVGELIDSQSFQFLNENLVRPDFLLGKFYRIKAKREAAA